MTEIYNLNAEDIEINPREVLRYLGYNITDIKQADIEFALSEINKSRKSIEPRVCYARYKINVIGDGFIDMPYGKIFSHDLSTNLLGCREIYIFAATIGNKFDREMRKAKVTSITDAACYQAIGATAIEDICEKLLCKLGLMIKKEGMKLRPRFSPGFGDFYLENQIGIFKSLQPEKYIGLTLMNTLIMAPEKSVTAIVGIDLS